MRNEHTLMAGCDAEFVTSNYGVRTTPRKEWEIALGERECPEEDKKDKRGRKVVRVLKRIEALKTLELAARAGLKDFEILAVVRHAK